MNDWKKDLEVHFKTQKRSKQENKTKKELLKKNAKDFIKGEVTSAFKELQKEFKKHKRILDIETKKNWAAALVKKNKHKEFVYEINVSADAENPKVIKRIYSVNKKGKLKLNVEGKIGGRRKAISFESITRDEIIRDFLKHYKDLTRS